MEKSSLRNRRCYICDENISISGKNIFSAHSDYTKTLICDILEKFVGRELDKNAENFLGCMKCISKINEYDLACTTADRIQKDFFRIMNQTEEKYLQRTLFLDDNEVKVDSDDPDNYTIIVKDESCKEETFEEVIDADQYGLQIISADEENCEDDNIEENCNYQTIYEYGESPDMEEVVEVREIEGYSEKYQEDESGNMLVEMSTNYISKTLSPLTLDEARKEATYSCRICRTSFSSLQKLREHKKQHNSDERFMCDICGMSYKTKTALNIHVGLHNGVSPFECDVCKKKFTQKGALTRHKPIHTGERPYQCDKCGKQFIHYSSFHMHKMAHDGVRDKKCEVCGLLLRSSSHLNRHMLVHTGQKPHACPKCGQRFAQRYNMMSHLRSHQGIHRRRKHVCIFCNKGFSKDVLLLEHLSSTSCGANSKIDIYHNNQNEVKLESTAA